VKRGEDHSPTLGTMNDLGVLGPEHPHTVESLNHLVRLYESWSKPEEAAKWRARLPHRESTLE